MHSKVTTNLFIDCKLKNFKPGRNKNQILSNHAC